jgi:hypothetical protein
MVRCRRSKWHAAGDHPNAEQEINAGLLDPKIKARLAKLGGSVLAGSPDFGKLLAEETEKWGKVVKFSGAKAD